MSNYTIIPQPIDINEIVDDDTIKVVNDKLKVDYTKNNNKIFVINALLQEVKKEIKIGA